jgi:hypothetical protein
MQLYVDRLEKGAFVNSGTIEVGGDQINPRDFFPVNHPNVSEPMRSFAKLRKRRVFALVVDSSEDYSEYKKILLKNLLGYDHTKTYRIMFTNSRD